MKIFVTGLCTLHWGRLEYGNVGNYYIIEPLFRELHRVFPNSEIVTTFQMTDEFIIRENITAISMDSYYGWNEHDLELAIQEYGAATYFSKTGYLPLETTFIKTAINSDVIINVSGDMWGDNAEHVGANRFLVDLLKMRTAQLLGKKTILFAGTPGPFSEKLTTDFAKEVFKNFDLVPNREIKATENLLKWNFDIHNVKNYACPAFLFEAASQDDIKSILFAEKICPKTDKPIIGFTICGFNMPIAPYDVWPRDDSEYLSFVLAIEHIINDLGARVVLISHTNGFDLPPKFKLKNGRDWPINKQLQSIVHKRGNIKNNNDLICVENPYPPKQLKAIIGNFDMFITGRLHASVGSMTQMVPTVFIMHGENFIRSTKIQGFANHIDMEEFVAEPYDANDIIMKIDACWNSRDAIRKKLQHKIPEVQEKARKSFDTIAEITRTSERI